MPTARRDVVIANTLGLHARPAMQFVDLATRFKSSVKVMAMGEEKVEADGKSIMQMMTLAATEGTPLRIIADGDDADEAVRKLCELIEEKFGEE